MLRDKFAIAAMQGLISAIRQNDGHDWDDSDFARESYAQADAMMKERANWDFSGDTDAAPIGVVLPSEKDAREFMAKHIHPAPVDGYQPKPKIIDRPPITNSPPRKP